MRYLLLMWADVDAAGGDQSDMDAWIAFDQKAREAGVFVDNGALQPALTEARLVQTRIDGHELPEAVERRPLAAGRPQIEAYYILECPDIETAVGWANDLPTYGQVEVRELIDFGGAGDA